MNASRPLSPHLQIYKLGLTGYPSILHRISGMISVGILKLLMLWLWALASGGRFYDLYCNFLSSWFGQAIVFLAVLSFVYHFMNGIRHLMWDWGAFLELRQVVASARVLFGLTIAVSTLIYGAIFLKVFYV
jgi:succinate dehydrogenase / fumarate reductase cytochrome b subunit